MPKLKSFIFRTLFRCRLAFFLTLVLLVVVGDFIMGQRENVRCGQVKSATNVWTTSSDIGCRFEFIHLHSGSTPDAWFICVLFPFFYLFRHLCATPHSSHFSGNSNAENEKDYNFLSVNLCTTHTHIHAHVRMHRPRENCNLFGNGEWKPPFVCVMSCVCAWVWEWVSGVVCAIYGLSYMGLQFPIRPHRTVQNFKCVFGRPPQHEYEGGIKCLMRSYGARCASEKPQWKHRNDNVCTSQSQIWSWNIAMNIELCSTTTTTSV